MIQQILAVIGGLSLWVLASIIVWKLVDEDGNLEYSELPFFLFWPIILLLSIFFWLFILPRVNGIEIDKLQKEVKKLKAQKRRDMK